MIRHACRYDQALRLAAVSTVKATEASKANWEPKLIGASPR